MTGSSCEKPIEHIYDAPAKMERKSSFFFIIAADPNAFFSPFPISLKTAQSLS